MDVKNCPASSQADQEGRAILSANPNLLSLSVYYNLLNWVAIYSEKNHVFAPRGDMDPKNGG